MLLCAMKNPNRATEHLQSRVPSSKPTNDREMSPILWFLQAKTANSSGYSHKRTHIPFVPLTHERRSQTNADSSALATEHQFPLAHQLPHDQKSKKRPPRLGNARIWSNVDQKRNFNHGLDPPLHLLQLRIEHESKMRIGANRMGPFFANWCESKCELVRIENANWRELNWSPSFANWCESKTNSPTELVESNFKAFISEKH